MHFRNGNDLAGIAQSCSLIVVVTDHVMEDPRVQAQVREAVTLDLPIIFVYETNKRFGAPLNQDKVFDIARVFGEQAPDDLKVMMHKADKGIPYQRGFERLVEAMLHSIVKQVGAALKGKLTKEAGKEKNAQWLGLGSASFSSSMGSPVGGDGIRMQQCAALKEEKESEQQITSDTLKSPLLSTSHS